jgi:hypothetical protein
MRKNNREKGCRRKIEKDSTYCPGGKGQHIHLRNRRPGFKSRQGIRILGKT